VYFKVAEGWEQRRLHDGGELHNFVFTSLLILSQELYRVYFEVVEG